MIRINCKERPSNSNRNLKRSKSIDSRSGDQDHEARREKRSIRKTGDKTVLRVDKSIERDSIESAHNLGSDREKQNRKDIDTILQVMNDNHKPYFIKSVVI
jgi:hypothetical protein